MTLANDRFLQSTVQFRTKDRSTVSGEQYTYNSRKKIYDVVVLNGQKLVRTNSGPLSPFISKWTPYHYDIENHFNI